MSTGPVELLNYVLSVCERSMQSVRISVRSVSLALYQV